MLKQLSSLRNQNCIMVPTLVSCDAEETNKQPMENKQAPMVKVLMTQNYVQERHRAFKKYSETHA